MISRKLIAALAFGGILGMVPVLVLAGAHTDNHDDPVPMTIAPLASLDFQPIRDGSTEMAVVWGDPTSGPSSVYLKFPPNFPMGLHTHTSNYHAVVIQGTTKHWDVGESEADAALLKAGDYWFQGANRMHQDSYPSYEEVIVFIHFDGPIDFIEAE